MTEAGMREKVAEAIRTSTQEVFSTMLGMDVQVVDIFAHSQALHPTDGVVSLIGLAGPWVGSGSIVLGSGLACKLAAALFMTDYDAVNEEVLDGVAEVTNMIIGNVKTFVEEMVGPMGLSIPTVIYGRNFAIRSLGNADAWTVVRFLAQDHAMEVQLCLTTKKEGLPASRLGFTAPTMAAK